MKQSSRPDVKVKEKWMTDNVCIYIFWSLKKNKNTIELDAIEN